jgi:hypothetical protein
VASLRNADIRKVASSEAVRTRRLDASDLLLAVGERRVRKERGGVEVVVKDRLEGGSPLVVADVVAPMKESETGELASRKRKGEGEGEEEGEKRKTDMKSSSPA